MTLSQWKTIGATTLACVLAMGGLRAFAQFGGTGVAEQAPTTGPADDDRQAALQRSVERLQTELGEAVRQNAKLLKQIQEIQAELKSFRLPGPASQTKASLPAEIKVGPPGQETITKTKISRLKVTPIVGPDAAALMIEGPRITRIAAARGLHGRWVTQELREPAEGHARPIVGPGCVAYKVGRFLYAFSPRVERWDVLELPRGVECTPIVGPQSVTAEGDGHVYSFNIFNAKWTDLNLNTILDTPQPNAPDDAAPNQTEDSANPRSAP